MTSRDLVRGRRRRRVGPLTFAAIGLTLVGAVAVAGFSSASAGPASPDDPRLLLQCQGANVMVTDVIHSVGGTVADTATPEDLVDRWAAGAMGQGRAQIAASPVKRTLFRSNDHARLSVLSSAGRVSAVVTMARTPELGWHIEVIHACA
jgi:hypothetical protein